MEEESLFDENIDIELLLKATENAEKQQQANKNTMKKVIAVSPKTDKKPASIVSTTATTTTTTTNSMSNKLNNKINDSDFLNKITVKHAEKPPVTFPFPYPQPYGIQTQLMTQLWKTIENARLGIFESPTGTGKSLSIICGSVHWLVERGEFYTQEAIKRKVENRLKDTNVNNNHGQQPHNNTNSNSNNNNNNNKTMITGKPKINIEIDSSSNISSTSSSSSSSRIISNRTMSSVASSLSSTSSTFLPFGRFQNVVFQNVNNNSKPDWVKQHEKKQVEREIDELNEKREKEREKLNNQIQSLKRKAISISYKKGIINGVIMDEDGSNNNNNNIQNKLKKKKKKYEKHWDDSSSSGEDDDNYDAIYHNGNNNNNNNKTKKSKSWLKEYILDPYYSADENDENKLLLSDDSDDEHGMTFNAYNKNDQTNTAEEVENIKILYCSRTHSQITQFINELKRTEFADKVKIVSLGSRKTLCINETLKKKSGMSTMKLNDMCLDLQKSKSKKKCCMYYDKTKRATFSAMALTEIHDVEDLVSVGRRIRSCPYYGSRNSIKNADIITMPYSMLLHEKTRDSLGVNVKGNVIIFDEAHNIIDTINQLHSAILTQKQIDVALFQIKEYKNRYEKKLSSKNLFYVNQIITILNAFLRFASNWPRGKDIISKVTDFMCNVSIDDMNVMKINRYIEESKICNKIMGYRSKLLEIEQEEAKEMEKSNSSNNSKYTGSSTTTTTTTTTPAVKKQTNSNTSKHISPLSYVQTFLLSTSNADTDGRIRVYYNNDLETVVFKYIMLNPALHFQNIIKDARSVVLAGGTMQPIKSVIRDLMSVDEKHVDIFSCGHVVSPDNVFAITFQKTPSNRLFNFNYTERNKQTTIDELGNSILTLTNIVPKGMVVFLPSYGYLDIVLARWKHTKLLNRIQQHKDIYFEPKLAKDVDETLNKYKHSIEVNKGAIIFCVVNAKLSEGINFGDDMARAVVMVGLPFPHAGDAELKEKMNFLDRKYGFASNTGRQYYEDLCMKAVNQSIGRAVRHQNDHAAIILLDHRYSRKSIQNKLPKWIMGDMRCNANHNFNNYLNMLRNFYNKMGRKKLM